MKHISPPTRRPHHMRSTHCQSGWMWRQSWLLSRPSWIPSLTPSWILSLILCTAAACGPRHTEPLPGDSLYQLTTAFTNDDGRSAALSDLRGQRVALAMIYTECVYVCPRIVADMKRLQRALAEQGGPDVRFVAVSFDPQRDTPAALRRYRKRRGLDQHWSLLTAPEPDVRELAAALGLAYTRLENGEFSHTIAITILDENGVILHRQEGNTGDTKAMLEYLRHSP